jgi:hypothetical protein
VGGHYDKSKTVSENLKLSPALLSRFDLVFILLDEVRGPNARPGEVKQGQSQEGGMDRVGALRW